MFLKRLELCGFKTFANRTDIEFVPGLMAIVGPNGSGKSNLTDAVRYVLGEQSARSLRAQKQDELIFAGTPDLRPSQSCEVTVTFDNSDRSLPVDFSEVALSRRVSRDGETQYSINKVPCRLRDIQELLMGSGVGPGSFFILGSREVDMVLSSDPKDRRLMLEETAGTNRYRFRRKEAVRKLEQTEGNLVRLHDLQGEVEGQVEACGREVARFERYSKAKEELQLCAAQLAWDGFSKAKEELDEAKAAAGKARQGAEKADAAEAGLQSRAEALQKEQDERQRRRDFLHQQTAELKASLSFSRASQDGVGRRLQQLDIDIEAAGERCREAEARCEERQKKKAELAEKLPELRSACSNASRKVKELEQSLHCLPDELTGDGASLRRALSENEQKQKKVTDSLEVLRGNLGRDGRRLKEAQSELEQAEENLSAAGVAQEDGEHDAAAAELEAAGEEMSRLKAELAGLRRSLQEARSLRVELERKRRPLSSRVMEMEAAAEEHIGMPPAVRAIMNWRHPGVVGVIGELIKVKEGMETALEVALGGRVNDIIVKDRRAASELVERLKAERAGRVTFWPLDLARHENEPPVLPTRQDVVGYSLDLIEFDPKLRPVLHQMLGQTAVMKNLESALSLYDLCHGRRPNLVTLQGEFLSGVGAVTGGTGRQDRGGMLTRSRSFADARRELSLVEAKISEASDREDELNDSILKIERSLTGAEERERSARQKFNDCESEARRGRQERQRLEKAVSSLRSEVQNLEDSSAAAGKQVAEAQDELDRLAGEWIEINQKLYLSVEEEKSLSDKRGRLQIELKEAELSMHSAAAMLGSAERELAGLRTQADESAADLERAGREKLRLEQNRKQAEAEGSGLDERIASAQEELNKSNAELNEACRVLEEENAKLQQLRREHLAAVQSAREFSKNLNSALIVLEGCQGRFKNAEAVWSERGVPITDDNRSEFDNIDIGKTSRRAEKLNSFLNNFGSVNLGAKAEYSRQKGRLDELCAQLKDVEEAASGLRGIIDEMDRALALRFKQVFAKVNKTFSDIFKEIFGGGWARLELCDPDNLLESGIDISACPPGKKLQNLTLFSSGERALSAIAFLFALLTHKPSPVVILDELDAPLDDSNVEKIARKLLNFAVSSQFLVVTHNRKTMEFAQRLYGVTMETPGISRLLSVELEDPQKRQELAESLGS